MDEKKHLTVVDNFRMPSGSSADQLAQCLPSHWLPRAGQFASIWAGRGNGVHDFLVRAWSVGRDAALSEIGDAESHRKLCEVVPFDRLPKGGQLEVAFAYNPRTGAARILGFNIKREYIKAGLIVGEEIAATADLVGVDGDVLVIADWKSGWRDLGPAKDSMQLKLLVLAGCRAMGFTKARAMFWYLREDGTTHGEDDVAEFDAFDLDAIAAEILDLVERGRASAASGRAETNPGDWCKYCECKPSCPSVVGLIKAALGLKTMETVTVAHASQLYSQLEAVGPIIKAAYEQLEEFAKHTPFPIAGGKIVRQELGESESLDPSISLQVMTDLHGKDVAIKAMTVKATKTGIKDALRPFMSKDRTLKALNDEVLAKIDAAGGIKRTQTCSVKAVKDKNAPTIKIAIEQDDGTMAPYLLPPAIDGAA